MQTIKLDFVQTLALSSLLLFVGYGSRKRVGFLDRFNPAAPPPGDVRSVITKHI